MSTERGSSTVTLALITPALLVMVSFAIYVGRVASTQHDIRSVARDAARSASIHPANASAAADDTARRALVDRDVSCRTLTIDTQQRPIGDHAAVTVTVRCDITTSDLTGLGLGGARTISATATEVIDRYRATP